MHDRPSGPVPPARPRSRTSGRRARGVPSYRPVRSPLVSMGPSLEEERRRRRALRRGVVVGVAALAVLVGVVALVAMLSREVVERPAATTPKAPVSLPAGRPEPAALARVQGRRSDPEIKLHLPINLAAITAIGYGSIDDPDVLELQPEGAKANLSWGEKLFRRFLATQQPTTLRYFMLTERDVPRIAVVGAPAGADVYAPISGTVTAITDNVIDNEPMGVVIQLQPLGDADTLVVLRNVDPAPDIAVGQTVSEGTSLLGFVRDLEGARHQPLSRYTHDAGTSLELYVKRTQPEGS